MTLKISEIFYSIQGESLYGGLPCIFVRLTGCNLRCSYCDTTYAHETGELLDIPEIFARIASFNCRLIEITGGEPLLQKETPVLISRLISAGYQVLLETNGSFDIGKVDHRCIKIMDIKCPSSGELLKNNLENLNRLHPHDQIKFVIGNREDYQYACKTLKHIPPGLPGGNVLFSPVSGILNPAELANWILQDGLSVRLHLQLHKIIWPDIQRGV